MRLSGKEMGVQPTAPRHLGRADMHAHVIGSPVEPLQLAFVLCFLGLELLADAVELQKT